MFRFLTISKDYSDRTTGARSVEAEIVCDSASDLPNNTADLIFLIGSKADVIETGDVYKINTSGTWILQPSQSISVDLSGYYTSAQIDDMIDPIQSAVTSHETEIMALSTQQSTQHTQIVNLQTSDTKQTNALAEIIDSGAKNRLPFSDITVIKAQNTDGTWSGNTYTRNGVTFTINNDFSITVNGKATGGNAVLVLSRPGGLTIEDGEWVLSGTPSGGSTTSYNISIAGTASDLGNSVEFTGCTAKLVRIYVISGTTVNNLVFRPMVCSKSFWQITNKYVPYCPSLQEIYRSLL